MCKTWNVGIYHPFFSQGLHAMFKMFHQMDYHTLLITQVYIDADTIKHVYNILCWFYLN